MVVSGCSVTAVMAAVAVAVLVVTTGVQQELCVETVKGVLAHPLAAAAATVVAAQVLRFRAYLRALALTTQAVNVVRRSHRKASASGRACGPAVASVPHLSSSLIEA